MSIVSFIMYCFIVTVTPGPTNILILSAVQNHGVKSAMRFTYGSTVAFGVLLTSSAVLNSVFINLLPKILVYMQILGSVYMIYLAYLIYKMDASEQAYTKSSASFYSGFVLQFLNPKVVIFALTVIPSFVLPYYNNLHSVTISVVGITVIGLVAFLLWVLFGAIFKDLLRKYNKIANIVMATFLVCAAVMVWF